MTKAAKALRVITATAIVCLFLYASGKPRPESASRKRPGLNSILRLGAHPLDEQMEQLPKLFFWAWERPEDLRFLETKPVGVAFLAKTIYVHPAGGASDDEVGGSVLVRPRLQPLRVASGTPLIGVVRIEARPNIQATSERESKSYRPAGFTNLQLQRLVTEIAGLQNIRSIRAIQIDFDASASQHSSYSALLTGVRGRLPASLPLSITALASWCIGDRWLEQLPRGTIDEAVPMLFRMGTDSGNVAGFLRSGKDFPLPTCRSSLGLSTDEAISTDLLHRRISGWSSMTDQRRVYVFAPRLWTRADAEVVFKELQP